MHNQLEYSKKLYFGKIPRSVEKTLPDWAIPDDAVLDWLPDGGFINDYMNYVLKYSKTPAIYHVATILSTMSFAMSGCTITSERFGYDKEGEVIPKPGESTTVPVLWSAIVGDTGDRKSTAMDFGQRILEKAIVGTDLEYAKAPDFASPEALSEHMAQNGAAFTFRDELVTLLAPSRRAHLEHMKSTLLLIYENKPLKRRRVSDTAPKSKEEVEDGEDRNEGVYEVLVEHPIKMILGCIPPKVFGAQTGVEDWDTGLLPRFMYWPGYLLPESRVPEPPARNDKIENRLARTLKHYVIKRATVESRQIIIPFKANYEISSWIHDCIDPLRGRVSNSFYAYLKRSRAAAIKIAACLAMAEYAQQESRLEKVFVTEDHVLSALELLDLINPHVMVLFNSTKRSRSGVRETAILSIIKEAKTGVTVEDLMELLDDAPSRAVINTDLKQFIKSGDLMKRKLPTPGKGAPPNIFYLPSQKMAVFRKVVQIERQIEEDRKRKAADRAKKRRASGQKSDPHLTVV